jgi:hypothetical protein
MPSKTQTTLRNLLILLVGSFLVFCLPIGLESIEVIQARSWPTVTGNITSLDIHKCDYRNLWTAQVNYAYEVNHKQYEWHQVAFMEKPFAHTSMHPYGIDFVYQYDADVIEQLKKEFEPRSTHLIHYDAARPEKSFIDVQINYLNEFLRYFIMLAFISIAAAAYLYLRLRNKKTSNARVV